MLLHKPVIQIVDAWRKPDESLKPIERNVVFDIMSEKARSHISNKNQFGEHTTHIKSIQGMAKSIKKPVREIMTKIIII